MNLSQAIHQRWAAATALERTAAGVASLHRRQLRSDACRLPSITKESDRPDSYQSDGSAIDLVVLRMRVFHSRYDAADRHRSRDQERRSTAPPSTSPARDKVLNMQRMNDYEQQRERRRLGNDHRFQMHGLPGLGGVT